MQEANAFDGANKQLDDEQPYVEISIEEDERMKEDRKNMTEWMRAEIADLLKPYQGSLETAGFTSPAVLIPKNGDKTLLAAFESHFGMKFGDMIIELKQQTKDPKDEKWPYLRIDELVQKLIEVKEKRGSYLKKEE